MTKPNDWPTFIAVQAVTLIFAALAVYLVMIQGVPDVPVMDEWDLLAERQLSQGQPAWYLSHHNEHRYPTGKFVWWQLLQAGNFNFRVPMLATVVVLAAAALLLQWMMRGWRGVSSPWDALYPALLLHWGHGFNFTMSYQIGFAMHTYGLCGWLWAGRWHQQTRSTGWLLMAMLYALLACSCGGFGLATTPVFLLWCGWMGRQSVHQRRWFQSAGLGAVALGWLAYAVWYYRTMPKTMVDYGINPLREPLACIAVVWKFLASSVDAFIYYPHFTRPWLGLALLLGVAAVAIHRWTRDRINIVFLSPALLSMPLIGVALAYGRGDVVAERYAIVAVPFTAALWAILTRSGTTRRWHWLVVLVAAGCLFWWNHEEGLRKAMQTRMSLEEFKTGLQSGTPPLILAGRYGSGCGLLVGDRVEWEIPLLRKLGVPLFQTGTVEAPYRKVGFPVPDRLKDITSDSPLSLPVPPPTAWAAYFLIRHDKIAATDFVKFRFTDVEEKQTTKYCQILLNHTDRMIAVDFAPGSIKEWSIEFHGMNGGFHILDAAWICPP